jgi:flagellar L-ring protein precursor FlgH
MWKKLSFMFFTAIPFLINACTSTEANLTGSALPIASYKDEYSEYINAENAKKPSPSLWADMGSHGTIFLDYKARQIGDVVIVRIVETSSANNTNNTSTGKTANYDSSITGLLGLPLNMGVNNLLNTGNPLNPTVGATTNNTFAGKGSKARSDSVSATIAARVVDILPSGNLVIEGQREIVVDQEKQTLKVRGMIRQKDIDSSNTVPSSSIADAQITYYGDGVITDANRKGWMANFVDWVWPF